MENQRPTKGQLAFLDWEFGLFFHFGIRTFHAGHSDWDGVYMDPAAFAPQALDCRQWAATAGRAGARYAIMTAKHHDGFALWNTKTTDCGVRNSAWRGGRGDVVREFTDACREQGLKVGLYYSPAEFGSRDRRAKDYDDYFIAQITELLTNYGKIDYLWFDGCGVMGLYDLSVGHGANLLLNVGPDDRGLIPERDAAVLEAFGRALETRFASPLPLGVTAADGGWLLSPEAPGLTPADTLVLSEDLTDGERAGKWTLSYRVGGKTFSLASGTRVGHKRIVRFPQLLLGEGRALRLAFDGGADLPLNIKLYHTEA